MAKNRANGHLDKRVEYYLEGPGREQLYSLDLQLARLNAYYEDLREREEPAPDSVIVRLMAETTRAVQRWQAFQLEGAIALKDWEALTKKMVGIMSGCVVSYLTTYQGMSKREARDAADIIEDEYARVFEESLRRK